MIDRANNIIRFPGTAVADIEAAAAGWLARMTSGGVTLGELAEFELWRATSNEHDRVFREIEAMWDGLGTRAARTGLHGRMLAGLRQHIRTSHWAARLGQIAAALVLMLTATQYLNHWRYEYDTAPGEIRRIALADGSVVTMRGNTALNAHVTTSGVRTIDLARGEAFFDVRHDATRPFVVIAGSGTVRDVGTRFSVARQGSGSTVEVEQGVVAVLTHGLTETLTAGEQLSFNLYDLGDKQPVETGTISAWRRGLYVAEGKPLGEVLHDINEYHPGTIILTSRALAARRVNAVVQLKHVDAWLDALQDTKSVSVRHWGPFTIVSDLRA